jgi:hypothetical protein
MNMLICQRYAAGRLAIKVTCPYLYADRSCLPAGPATRLLFATVCLSACLIVRLSAWSELQLCQSDWLIELPA